MKRIVWILILLLTACAGTDGSTNSTSLPSSTAAAPRTTSAILSTTTTAGAVGASTASVGVSDFAFSPASLTVNVGDTVAWNLTDGSHTSTSGTPPDGDGVWSETLSPDAPFTFTFTEAGEYAYFCRFHPDFMTGMVIVEP